MAKKNYTLGGEAVEESYIYQSPLTIKAALASDAASRLSIHLRPAPPEPSPGEPGKRPGELFFSQDGAGSQRVVVSLGLKEKCSADAYRQAGGVLGKWLQEFNVSQADLDLAQFDTDEIPGSMAAFLEGLYLGSYQFRRWKKQEQPAPTSTIFLHNSQNAGHLENQLGRIAVITNAVNLAREWSHEPANVINPVTLAGRVQKLAEASGLKCSILDDASLAEMKAEGILSVGKGSKTPARLILLEYDGHGDRAGAQPVVIVGKAITFDSGGYSIKGTDHIQGMKYDKCGGVAVAAILSAAAQLQLKTPLIGVIAAAENMISANSYRPDDILTTLAGKTVEVVSTDAEGRLVLADALTYAQRMAPHPRAIIDLATLTGGVLVALGRVRAGLMANNQSLAQQLIEAGERTHERLWRLPLDDDYLQAIKGDDADLKNSGGREGASILGGIFLKQFVGDNIPWAHIDVAGVAFLPKDEPYSPKGATGFGVRLVLDFLENLPQQ